MRDSTDTDSRFYDAAEIDRGGSGERRRASRAADAHVEQGVITGKIEKLQIL